MKDSSLVFILGLTCILFAAVAAYVHHLTAHVSRRARIKPPPPRLLVVTRLWFALLSLGCLTLLVLSLLHG